MSNLSGANALLAQLKQKVQSGDVDGGIADLSQLKVCKLPHRYVLILM
jgi:hypothetical protein